jgi:hypothetical protein
MIRDSDVMGNGIYKSVDGGKTWTNMGLPDSGRIGRIVIHPTNPDIVFACSRPPRMSIRQHIEGMLLCTAPYLLSRVTFSTPTAHYTHNPRLARTTDGLSFIRKSSRND